MQVLCSDERQAMDGESLRGVVDRLPLVDEIQRQGVPIPRINDLLLVAEVIQDVGRMLALGVDLRLAALVLGRDVCNVISHLDELIAAVIGLADDVLDSFGDVVFKAHNIFES